ncbi:MAG: phospho-N-acetylmuramoyl-pentapeptide-transferase, partial [Thermodesulfobacteriota bacterium]
MLYHLLYPLNNLFAGFNVFRYITFRTIGAAITAFLFFVLVAPAFIRYIRNLQIGQVIRADGPETHLQKEGVPTMGGMLIIFTIINATLLWTDLTNRYVWLILGVTLWFGVIGAIDDFKKININSSKGL